MAQVKLNLTSLKNFYKEDPMMMTTTRKGTMMAMIEQVTQGLSRYMYNLTNKAFMTNSIT